MLSFDQPTKQEQIEATRASIAKWEQNRDESDPNAIVLGAGACPLCILTNVNCTKCPIPRFVEVSGCAATPYRAAAEALSHWKRAHNSHVILAIQTSERHKWQHLAQEEVTFLEIILMGLEEGSI